MATRKKARPKPRPTPRAQARKPRSLLEFQKQFPDDAASGAPVRAPLAAWLHLPTLWQRPSVAPEKPHIDTPVLPTRSTHQQKDTKPPCFRYVRTMAKLEQFCLFIVPATAESS